MRHIAVVSILALAAGANAQVIGGSDLVGNSELNTLSGWLGEGPLKITNIFDHKAGDGKDASSFHTAADNQGRTFSVYRDTNGNVFGGYNPQSWDSFSGWHINNNNNGRTAFLFNLTSGTKYAELTDGDFGQGQYETYNSGNYGPTFGGGHDLYSDQILGDGGNAYSYGYSYGNVYDGSYFQQTSFQTSDLEVFTITNVPAPTAGALLGLGGLMAARRRRN